MNKDMNPMREAFEAWEFTVRNPKSDMPWMTHMIYQVCDNDENKFEIACEIVGKAWDAAYEAGVKAEREKVRKLRYYLGEAITEIDDQQACADHPAWCTVHNEKPWRCEQKRTFIEGAKQALKDTE